MAPRLELVGGAQPPLVPKTQSRVVSLVHGERFAVCRGPDVRLPDGHARIEVACPKISRVHLLLHEVDGTWRVTKCAARS